ncbi:eukaryotic translation initiation factor 4B isoform X2 [Thrips palmi]|uniref:Eukaryotic translation initiation factor 4B isoform X2 n=1 Tax=Thrips palmi TaxID=161013 RepID=A0A6P8Y7D5_THRPL|nr:eukaryotic translation initiation factor 4B isoform X2 [Thrips palmi]
MSKKNKKNKWKQVDLGTVLQETRPVAWAEEVEIDERDLQIAAARKSALPTAPRSARGTDDERVPNSPPYVAYITNIPFETIEEDIEEFFRDLQLETIRLPRNDATGKLKGYGYVEFTERAGLIEALQIADTSMKGRRIRIDVSENNDRDRGYGRSDRMGRDRMGMGMGREEDPERTMGDWRSGPRSEPAGEDRGRSGGRPGFGGFGDRDGGRERDSGFGAPREMDNREGGWREGMGSGTGGSSFGDRDRDRDSFRSRGFGDRDRDGGGMGSRYGDRGGDRYGDRGGDRYSDRGGDRYGGDRDGDRPRFGGDRDGDRYGGDRPRYGGDREEGGDRFARRDDGPPSDSSGEARARPKLQLQPRTRPVEVIQPTPEEKKEKEIEEREKLEKEKAAQAPPVPRASIFGAAKPVDTTAREREIEERLAKERDRAPRRDDPERKDKDDSGRSREANEDGDESKKVEPAPPPKENAWSRRPRLDDASSNNGDTKANDRGTSENEGNDNKDDRSRDRNHINNKERESSDLKEDEFRDFRTNRSGSRDKKDVDLQKEDGSNADRYERKAGRGRVGPHGSQKGMGHARVDRVTSGGGGNKGKQPTDRPSRRDHSNEDRRLPKYEEKPQPNFVASNKYAYLNEDDQED